MERDRVPNMPACSLHSCGGGQGIKSKCPFLRPVTVCVAVSSVFKAMGEDEESLRALDGARRGEQNGTPSWLVNV